VNDVTQEQQSFAIIREAASRLKPFYSHIAFEPLFGRHASVASVTVMSPSFGAPNRQDVWLTLWSGYRDGLGQDGSEKGTWLCIEEMLKLKTVSPEPRRRNAAESILRLNPDDPDFGLDLPDVGRNKEMLLEAIKDMSRMLNAAIPVHRNRANREAAFAALNAVLNSEEPDETLNLVDELERLCADSDLESVEFGPYDAPGEKPFAATTFIDVGDQLQMTVWSAPDGSDWIDVGGRVQKINEELLIPAEDQEEAEVIAGLARQLTDIHDAAGKIFRSLDPDSPDTAFDLLNSVAYMAMNGGYGEDEAHHRPWHTLADEFTSHCRLGFLAGVMLEESPFGNLNIRATTFDPATRKTTDLQVYWKQDDEGDEPEHWLSVGTATGPAHDVEPEYPELLAGVAPENREHIRHAISHLHEMVHLAGSILEAKTAEASGFLDNRQAAENVPDTLQHIMIRSTIEDTIAGLNRIALLYTGAMPD
jgi:hypothetical protein